MSVQQLLTIMMWLGGGFSTLILILITYIWNRREHQLDLQNEANERFNDNFTKHITLQEQTNRINEEKFDQHDDEIGKLKTDVYILKQKKQA